MQSMQVCHCSWRQSGSAHENTHCVSHSGESQTNATNVTNAGNLRKHLKTHKSPTNGTNESMRPVMQLEDIF